MVALRARQAEVIMDTPRKVATPEEKIWWAKLRKLCERKPKGLLLFAASGSLYGVDSENYMQGSGVSEIIVALDVEPISVHCDGGDPNWA